MTKIGLKCYVMDIVKDSMFFLKGLRHNLITHDMTPLKFSIKLTVI